MGEILNLTRLFAIARKEVIQLRRDYRSLALAFLLPLLLLIIFGYAISWDIRDIETGVIDQDQSMVSRDLIDAMQSSGYFTIVKRLGSPREIEPMMQRGEVQMVLVIPPDFSADIGSGQPARLQAIVDGSDANTATIVLAYTQAIVQTWSSRAVLEGRIVNLPVTVASRVWYNEDLVSRNMIVPGLVAVIMMIIGAMLTSLTIAREWERGTMEQLASTPVSRLEVVLGKLLPYIAIGLIDVVSSMPQLFQTITLINPMRHYLEIVRGVFLKGAPFEAMWPQFLALFVIGALLMAFAVSRFEKRVS